jgi:hypothetical protein
MNFRKVGMSVVNTAFGVFGMKAKVELTQKNNKFYPGSGIILLFVLGESVKY